MNSRYGSISLRAPGALLVIACVIGCSGHCDRGPVASRTERGGTGSTGVAAAATGGIASTSSPHSAVAATACPEYPWGRKGRNAGFSAVDSHPVQFREFLEKLKKAVASDDRDAVLSLISFPAGTLSKSELVGRYDEIMTECLRESIRCAAMDDVAEDYLGAWVAHDALLVEWTKEQFLITGFTGEGPCYPKRSRSE